MGEPTPPASETRLRARSDPTMVRPLRMGDVARMMGWSTRRTRRMLVKLHHGCSEALLVRADGHWTVTLAALRERWPEFGDKLATCVDLTDVAIEQERQGQELQILAKAMRKLQHRVKALEVLRSTG